MEYWREIWKTIRSGKTSTSRDAKNITRVQDSTRFKALSLSKHEEIVSIIDDEQVNFIKRFTGSAPATAQSVRDSAKDLSMMLMDYTPGKVVQDVTKVKDGYEYRETHHEGNQPVIRQVRDSYANLSTSANVMGQDPNTNVHVGPNLWISPGEAASIYSQGGLSALIINKKSKTIRHNEIRITNPKLDASELDTVNESAQHKTGFADALARATVSGLVYGGSLLFPMFKKDSPITMVLPLDKLMQFDIVRKGCIDRYIDLDRNNAIHIPNWDPTSADFLNPRKYFIPYLGSDVSGMRCARIVPVPQAGYWGTLMTMGWGNSEVQGWYQAVCNYEGVMSAIPSMIRQMSILVHTYNVDLANALNGAVTLEHLKENDTLAVREASASNPVSMDAIGELKSIERDFTAVAELARLVRQDVGAKSTIPEEKIWSSDRGAFASGDQTQGLNEREWEGSRFIYGELESRCRSLAMLEIINALGKDRRILEALPYTNIEILNPRIESAELRGTVVRDLAESVFQFVASGMELDSALDIVLPYGDKHLVPRAEIVRRVHAQQKKTMDMSIEKEELNIELLKAQIESAKKAAENTGNEEGGNEPAVPKSKSDGDSGYTKLEQRKKEKTRGLASRREGIQRAKGKKA